MFEIPTIFTFFYHLAYRKPDEFTLEAAMNNNLIRRISTDIKIETWQDIYIRIKNYSHVCL